MDELIQAIKEQTAAINALVESNQRLMLILIEGAAMEDMSRPVYYLDGSDK